MNQGRIMPWSLHGALWPDGILPNSTVKQWKRSPDFIFSSATDSFTMERTLLPLHQLPDVSNRSAQCDAELIITCVK